MKKNTSENSPLINNARRQIVITGAETFQLSEPDSVTKVVPPTKEEPLQQELIKAAEEPAITIKKPLSADSSPKTKKSFSNNHSVFIQTGKQPAWFIVAASATGKSHLQTDIPCQDNHYSAFINEKWGIAITSDGAGSAANSHLGSAYVATQAGINSFRNLVISKEWHLSDRLPTKEEWRYLARETCISIYNELENFAAASNIAMSSLACTLTVVIYCPEGLLITHIGDGRAGFLNQQHEWKPVLTPHKGEEANQTIFITSDKWITDPEFLMSGVPVPESTIISEKVSAFTLLTDGCESHSFECSVMDTSINKWYDPNMPSPKFFNPLVKNLRNMYESNTKVEASNDKWRRFMETGTPGLETEPDDKTMILGILI